MITTEKLIKKFKKKMKKHKNVFAILSNDEKSVLLGLKEPVTLDTLLIHYKNNDKTSLQGFINKIPINDSSIDAVFLDLEYPETPEVFIPVSKSFDRLADSIEDFIIIFCEFEKYNILFYIFNTPFCQISKKSLSHDENNLTSYFKKIFLSTLPDDQRKEIQTKIYTDYSQNIDLARY